ncbi:cytochrome P450 [soil metagenome]
MSGSAQSAPPDILSSQFYDDPAGFFKLLRNDYPLLHHEASGYYFISRQDDVKRALKDEALYSTVHQKWQLEPVIGRSLGGMTGKEHATQRSLVAPSFRGTELAERFTPIIHQNARRLLDDLPSSGQVDLVGQFTKWFPINVIADMLGLPKGDHERFHDWYSSFMAYLSNITQDPDVIAWGERTKQEFPEYILPIIQARRENPGDDLVSILATAEIDGAQMTDDQIRSFIGLLLIAGGETTDKAIASIFKNLMEHPEQLEMVKNDRSLVTAAFAETLRFSPPVNIVLRTSEQDVDVADGGVIPAHSTVGLVIGAANRDERVYADADTFNIMREDLHTEKAFSGAASHMAFGNGRHFCVGSFLAKAEIETAVNLVLDLMPEIRFAPGFVPKDVGLFTRAPETLLVEF